MADQDFNINIRTTADTAGIQQTSAALDKLKQQQRDFLSGGPAQTGVEKFIAARQAAAATEASTAAASVGQQATAGLTGTAVGVGTIITLLSAAVNKWREFEEEQDRWIDGMVKATEKSHALGLEVADMLDAMKSAERIDTEPLQISFDRLKQKVNVLKTEMQLAFGAGEYEDVKRIASALGVVESQLHRVTSALEQQAKAQARAAEERAKAAEKEAAAQREFQNSALNTSSPQAKAILANEAAARKARAQGDEISADQFQRSADQLKKSATPGQLAEYEQLNKALNPTERPGRAAVPGESQEAVDKIEQNRLANEKALREGMTDPAKVQEVEKNKADFDRMIKAQEELRDLWK